MRFKNIFLIIMSVLLLSSLTAVSADAGDDGKVRVTYICYTPNEALELASESNDYRDLIEYTFIDYLTADYSALTSDVLNATESGFL
ncbi:hypothetical protein, partial [Methanococcus maripaludis]|uniref:hypothetical protein n=1 Tax=Methanococcus maripaludis TaxID=39152 RepID=UPI001C67CF65